MIKAEDITVEYGETEILKSVSFELSEGKILVLLGANGAGKTTLIRALNGTIPLSAGRISLDGCSLDKLGRREIARNIAVVAQENETRFPVSVLEFVLSGRFSHGSAFGWESDIDIRIAEQALAACNLAEFRSRLMNHLSGGERQRVVLARALATEARILLLDEPTANLDLAHQARMFHTVRERCSSGFSAVLITHDLNLASEFADEIIMLKSGQIFANGAPEEVLTEKKIKEVFGVTVMLDKNPSSHKMRVTPLY